jgi:hypothetical protein
MGRFLVGCGDLSPEVLMGFVRDFFAAVHRDNRLLSWVAWAHVVLAVAFLCAMPFDPRLVGGINPWIKPFKFAASIALYAFTLAYVMRWLPGKAFVRRISWGVAAAMVIEIVLITLQAGRGVRSHFNQSSVFDGVVFGVMGATILGNTLLDAWVAWRFFQPGQRLSGGTLWGVRLGLLLFVLGSLEGFVMVAHLSHTVGVPDGGPGLPLVNWSTQGGDLRISHFLALHSLQVLPLVGLALDRFGGAALRRIAVPGVLLAAAAYALLVAALLMQALHGVPLLGG